MSNLKIKLSTENPIPNDSLPKKAIEIHKLLHNNEIDYTVQITPSADPEHYDPKGISILNCTIQDFKGETGEADKIYGILKDLGYKIMSEGGD